jgi:hypothetical protein
VAELIRNELGMEAELARGWLGELTVWVDGRRVARRGWFTSPPDRFFFAAVQEALRL